jgi:protein involved in polysaccharide export with SLBB domain
MKRNGLLAATVAALVVGWAGLAAPGETVTPQELERLKRLARDRNSAVPTIPALPEIKKSEPGPGSQSEAQPSATPALLVSVPQPVPPAPEPEVSPFERYVAAAGPGEMSAGIRQFGYSLFGGAPDRYAPVTAIAAGQDYVLGPGDEVLVRIWGKAELQANAFVDREGKLSLPKAGVFPVAGKTLGELREQVKAQYDKVFVDYGLDVSLGALKSIGVLVVGTVAKPGRYRVSSVATVINALIEAGGPTKSGSLRAIKVVRAGKEVAAVDLYELLLTGKCSADIRLQPEDTVFVPPVGPRVAVLGGVRVPAIYELGSGEVRLPKLMEMAGGLEATGVAGRVQIERIEGDGHIALSEHSLVAKDGKELPALKNGDIVRIFQVVKKYANVVYLHGNVARAGAYEFKPGMKVSDLIPGPAALIPEKAWTPGEAPRPLPTTTPAPGGSKPGTSGSGGSGSDTVRPLGRPAAPARTLPSRWFQGRKGQVRMPLRSGARPALKRKPGGPAPSRNPTGSTRWSGGSRSRT